MNTTISELKNYDGKNVILNGWVYNIRSIGKILFLILRDGSGLVQCVVVDTEPDKSPFELDLIDFTPLSLISFLIKRKTKIILCVVGLGYLFIKKNFTNTLIKAIYINLMKFFLRKKNSIYVFQNNDDKDVFEQNKLLRGIKYEIC